MPEWFAEKRYGIGAGLPITWQGWAISSAYVAIMLAAGFFVVELGIWAFGSIVVVATAAFLLVTAKTTRGGWRWRWGGDE